MNFGYPYSWGIAQSIPNFQQVQQPIQQQVPQQQFQPMQQPVQSVPMQMEMPTVPADDRIWVQGKNAAESYILVPNAFVRMWDSTGPYFYEKRADSSGKPLPLETFKYSRVDDSQRFQSAEEQQYVPLPEYQKLLQRFDYLEKLFLMQKEMTTNESDESYADARPNE